MVLYEPFLSAPSAMRNADLLNSTTQEKNTVTRQHTHGNWIVSCVDTHTCCPCKDICRLYNMPDQRV